jgi:hypothetical protein
MIIYRLFIKSLIQPRFYVNKIQTKEYDRLSLDVVV